MCDWNQDYLPTHRETEQSSEIHIIFCVWIKPKQTKKGGKIPHDHLVEMEISGCSEIQNWFGKGFLHPFLKLPSDQFVLAAAAACLEECCRAVVLLRGLNAAPHFPLAAVNIQSESSSCVHLVKMLRSRYVWLFFFYTCCFAFIIYTIAVVLQSHKHGNSQSVFFFFCIWIFSSLYENPTAASRRLSAGGSFHYPEGKWSDEL